ncbi:MAG TPA: ArsI/CadI family heavy metal resistance metalloenzyme [Candidatus Kapabacteria bacterium]|nr:ArsI/CadI family heavy metal resistance metalloenzyme [Candidatus Kapabacteria bacterium]
MNTTILFPHISLNVSRLDTSVAFYNALFAAQPVKQRPGYAKYELQNPKLNFTLNQRTEVLQSNNSPLNHFGLQVESTDDVLLMDIRLRKLGLRTIAEEQTICCYALQDKIWVTDPDGVSWEVFVVHSDADVYRDDVTAESACCTPSPVQITTSLAA